MAWYRCVGGAGGSLKLRTASGRIATFSTNMVEAFKSLKTDINPVQDLHGYTKPWSGGGGKNKLNITATTQTINGITFTIDNEGVITTSGTFSENTNLAVTTNFFLKAGTYILNGCPSGGSYSRYVVRIENGSAQRLALDMGNGEQFTLSEDTYVWCRIYLYSSDGIGKTFKPMVRLATESDSSFAPYENICPISGFSALNVTRTGKNLFKKGVSTSANGVTFTVNDDGSISLSGTATNTAFFIAFENMEMPYGTYTLSGGYSALIAIYIRGSSSGANILGSTGSPSSGVINTGVITGLIRIQSGTNTDGITLKPQLEVGNQATDYTPYNGQTATVNFGQTVYKGVADVTNGKLTLTHGYLFVDGNTSVVSVGQASGLNYVIVANTGIDSINTSATHPIVSNEFVSSTSIAIGNAYITGYGKTLVAILPDQTVTTVAQANTWFSNNNAQFVYELATPIEITTTPENLTAIVGQNNVYSDTNGDTEVKYLYRG